MTIHDIKAKEVISRAGLEAFFNPETVAIIGASTDPHKIGGLPVSYCQSLGFLGRLIPINPKAAEVQGLPAFRSIADVPGSVDCAILAVPRSQILDAVRACAAKQVKALLVFSAGFAEADEQGRAAQKELASIARASGMRILGPNCLGLMNIENGFAGTFTNALEVEGTHVRGWPKLGSTGIVSQSGAIGSYILSHLRERGLGVSKWITTGNQIDVDVSECIAFLAGDPATRVIVTYLEGTSDGAKFAAALEKAAVNGKPVLVLKVGATAKGAEAVQSHTATLAGEDRVYDAVIERMGALRVDSIVDLVDLTAALVSSDPRGSRRTVAISTSGGAAVMFTDAAERNGLSIKQLEAGVAAALAEEFPSVGTSNPIDVAGPGMADMSFIPLLSQRLVETGGFDTCLVFINHLGLVPRLFDEMRQHFSWVPKKQRHILVGICGIFDTSTRAQLEADGFWVVEDPSRCIKLVAMLDRARFSATRPSLLSLPANASEQLDTLHEAASKEFVARWGIQVSRDVIVQSPIEAVEATRKLGLPVAAKLLSRTIIHKSDVGGVMLNLRTEAEVEAAFNAIRTAAEGLSNSEFEGVLISAMESGKAELIVGTRNDPVFGPVIAVGFGGTLVELLDDVQIDLPPLSVAEAERMIRSLRGFPLLDGVRGGAPLDVEAVAELISHLSQGVVAEGGKVHSVELNPVLVRPRGAGCVAVDSVVKLFKALP
jgi:acyl-CoA synthetase (NDP forming)